MNILQINAENEFMSIISAVAQKPHSWVGWYALHLSFADIKEEDIQDCLLWAKSILGSYLDNIEGRAYFCFGRHIHVICKNAPLDILEQAGHQICDFIFDESQIISEYHIYDLARYGDEYYVKSGACDKTSLHLKISPPKFPMVMEHGFEGFWEEEKQSIDLQDCALTKVLLVEDDPVTRWMVRNALKQECEFATATCANKAYAMYSSFQPDLVFLDINLPDQRGTVVLEWIMRNDPGACVVMFSSQSKLDMIAHTLDAGASGFVSKPFLKKDLLHYVRNV